MSTRIPRSGSSNEKQPPPMRKEPRQARSRAMVEAIVGAGARVLGDRGMDDFTTNEVADVAGVSIGSLYQYFPDKLALIDAIRRRHLDDVLSILHRVGQDGRSLQEVVETLVDGMIAIHSIEPALHRVLLDEAPGYDGGRSIQGVFEKEYMARYQAIVVAFREGEGRAPVEIAAQVLSSAVEGVIHNAARRRMLKSGALRQELIHLVSAYLGGSAQAVAGLPVVCEPSANTAS